MFVETLYRAKRGPRIEACAEDVDDERAELFDSRSSDCGDVVGFRRRDRHSEYSSDLIWVRNSLIGGVNHRIDLLLGLRGVIQLMSGRKSVTRRWCSLKADKSIRDWQSTSIEPAFTYANETPDFAALPEGPEGNTFENEQDDNEVPGHKK